MKYSGRNASGQIITGTLHKEWSNGITIEFENGVREFINTNRVIGPVNTEPKPVATYRGDLFQ